MFNRRSRHRAHQIDRAHAKRSVGVCQHFTPTNGRSGTLLAIGQRVGVDHSLPDPFSLSLSDDGVSVEIDMSSLSDDLGFNGEPEDSKSIPSMSSWGNENYESEEELEDEDISEYVPSNDDEDDMSSLISQKKVKASSKRKTIKPTLPATLKTTAKRLPGTYSPS